MKTLYLHIGTPKTGTSSIQKFLADNRKTLEQHGYCYPKSVHKYPCVHKNRNAHFMVARLYDSDGTRQTALENAHWEEGLARIADCFKRYDHVVLSDESIWKASQSYCKTLFSRLQEESSRQGYQIMVIVYLRRQDQFFLSCWNQSVKYVISKPMPWEKYQKKILKKETYLLDYAGTLDEISASIGKDHIIVRRFTKDFWPNGSILEDFMNCIGLEITDDFIPLAHMVNPRLQGNTLEIKRIINSETSFTREETVYLGNFLRELAPESGQRYPSCMMSQTEIQTLLQRYEAGNSRVAAEYIGDDAPLFSSEIKNLPKWQPDNPYMTEDVIRFFSAVSIDLHRENERLHQENESLREEMKELHMLLKKEQTNLRTFKDKLKHPLRTLLHRLFHRNKPLR